VLIAHVTGFRASFLEGEGHYAQMILTLGVALVLHNGGLIVFDSSPVTVRTPLSVSAWQLGLWGDVSIFVNKARFVTGVISASIAVLLFLFMRYSRLGKSLKAAADNPVASIYVGIDVDRGYRIAFGLGAGITAIAGGLLATYYPFQPYVGFDFTIIMYIGVVLGGLGSVAGAFWGGMMIGLIQQLSTLVLPNQLQNTAIFVVFLLTLFLRPQGLLGNSVERA
jgi:branched-chain amino acid transport system permease protein